MALWRQITSWLLLFCFLIEEGIIFPTQASDLKMKNPTKQRKSTTGDPFMTKGAGRGESVRLMENRGPRPIDESRKEVVRLKTEHGTRMLEDDSKHAFDTSRGTTFTAKKSKRRASNMGRKCRDGYFGKTCKKPCNSNCQYVCKKDDGRCISCHPGRFGEHCDQLCPKHCGSRDCRITDGKCSDGCQKGFSGDHCSNPCDHCINSTCDFETGACKQGNKKVNNTKEILDFNRPQHCENSTVCKDENVEPGNAKIIVMIICFLVIGFIGIACLLYKKRSNVPRRFWCGLIGLITDLVEGSGRPRVLELNDIPSENETFV